MIVALGVFECRGMIALAAAVDAMGKAADVRVTGRHGIGSGWLTVVVEGVTADVQTAMAAAKAAVADHGEVITAVVLPRPELPALTPMPHSNHGLMARTVASQALGFLETKGVAPLVIGVDTMLKAADVSLYGWTVIGGALVYAVIGGRVGDVEVAIAAGRRAVADHGTREGGELSGSLVLEQPEQDMQCLLPPAVAGKARSLSALGVVETTGYVGAVHAADRLVKEADVDVVSLTVGSGGRVATVAVGALDSVKAAVTHAAEALPAVAELNGQALISNPDPQLVAAFAQPASTRDDGELAGQALGLLETRSTVGLVSAVDAMLKSSHVTYEGRHKVGYFLSAAVIRGELGAVTNALDVGARAAQRHGELVARLAIALPYPEMTLRLPHA